MLDPQLIAILMNYQDPYLNQDLVTANTIKKATLEGSTVSLDITLGYPCATQRTQWIAELSHFIKQQLPDVKHIDIQLDWQVQTHRVQQGVAPLPGVKNVIAVGSGKGGVGKSTVAVNLALALTAEGARVGILDADIYGPSQPWMLGVQRHPESKDEKTLEPIVSYGVQSMSIGYLIDMNTPMIWRGPMVSTALQQLLYDTRWHELDYLLVDLPPGTGDIQLTLAQKIPVSGAVIVTTPQDLAVLDARKAIAMFEKVHIPILGVIENMSTHVCSHCGHEEAIFGQGGGAQLALESGVKLLGTLPLHQAIQAQADSGKPTVVAEPHGVLAEHYYAIARQVAAILSQQIAQKVSKFPRIVVEES